MMVKLIYDYAQPSINSLPSEKITIKDLKNLEGVKDFNNSIYQIPSRFRFRHIVHDWPIQDFSISGEDSTYVDIVNDFLVKPNCPAYPTFTEATRSFLGLDQDYFNNNPYGVQIFIPDFRGRIVTLELSEKNISINLEIKEAKLNELILKIYAKNKEQEYLPEDYEVTSEKIEFDLPFEPNVLDVYLVNKDDGNVVDYVKFGSYDTDNHEGIIIKTSKEIVENLIAKGESNSIEFKRDFSKDEFLETVVSFSNSGSGKILLGVDDKGNVLGIYDDYLNLVKRIKGTISGRCEPQIEVGIEEVEVQGKPVVVVNVKEGRDKPYLVRAKSAYIRVDNKDLAMSRIDLDRIYQKKNTRTRDNISL